MQITHTDWVGHGWPISMRLGLGISDLEAAACAQRTLGEDGPFPLAETVQEWQCVAECVYIAFKSQSCTYMSACMHACTHTYGTLYYVTLHYTTLHYVTLHRDALQYMHYRRA